VALLRNDAAYPVLRRFSWLLALVAGGGFLLFGVTPLAPWWYQNISGLSPDLVTLSIVPTILLAPVPFLNALISWNRSVLIARKETKWISGAVALNMATLLILVLGLPMVLNTAGAVSASLVVEWVFLWWASERRQTPERAVVPIPIGD
jgi:O-antigen/teichoic acid export membrane protein